MIAVHIAQVAALACGYLDNGARDKVVRFIRSRWNRDGGVQGRDGESDLYYTVFAAIGMKALGARVPLLRLWNYIRSFGDGESLDIIHLFCLVRLRCMFPITNRSRERLIEMVDRKQAESAMDLFFKVVMAEYLEMDGRPETELLVSRADSTPSLAATVVVNHRPDKDAEAFLMERYCPTGGFCERMGGAAPDLLSTATALFALKVLNVDCSPIREACLGYIQSLQRDDGGFSCRDVELAADTECTFYALLSFGCLMA